MLLTKMNIREDAFIAQTWTKEISLTKGIRSVEIISFTCIPVGEGVRRRFLTHDLVHTISMRRKINAAL